jgi:beta-galactosidase
MEQQPGPVNWAAYNPAPAEGMVRHWTLEAFAHGAEALAYFRWRQAPFGQEQMHAGLNRPDGALDQGGLEAQAAALDLKRLGPLPAPAPAPAALVFDYAAAWALETQPQGKGISWIQEAFAAYAALRRRGIDVDMVPPGGDLSPYRIVLVPCLPTISAEALEAFAAAPAEVLFGPRSGSRTLEGRTPDELPPGPLQSLLPFKTTRVESLRPGAEPEVALNGARFSGRLWRERLESDLPAAALFADGTPALLEAGRFAYLATFPSPELLEALIVRMAERAGVASAPLPEGLRLRRRGPAVFAFNTAGETRRAPTPQGARVVLGDPVLAPGGVCVWRED